MIKRILKAMNRQGGAGTPMTLKQVAQTAGLTPRTVSGNNKFLISTGLVTRSGNNFYLTERGAQLALALEYDDVEDVGRAWRSVAIENEFFKRVLDALDLNRGMTEEEFALHIARAAGAPTKDETYLAGGRAIVQIMLEAGLASQEEKGEKLQVTADYRDIRTAAWTGGPVAGEEPEPLESAPSQKVGLGTPHQGMILNVNVTVTPATTAEEIEGLAARIKELREKLK